MGKQSSLKKKRSKNSSQSRMRKRNKVKNRKSKSKKLRRQQDDSASYSDDSDSRSMVSVSSSSSEDDYRSRSSRSHNRKDVKGGKKRARRRSSSRESSEDSPYVKKRRGSRRDDRRKRTSKRKKSTRDVSLSSRSGGSWSCSTCRSDSDEIGYTKRRGRSETKEKDGRKSEKFKRGSKRSKGRSRSCSSCSRYNEGSDHSVEERMMEELNSRRLKSVITVVKQENESSRELNTDEPTEEVYNYDDYPSCRSNDSNDGRSRRELRQHTHVVSETKRPPDDDQGEVSNIGTSSVEESGKDGKLRYEGVGKNDAVKEKINVSSANGGLNGDDIESILRQRALENLRKFRGGLQKNMINPPITQNDKSVGDVKKPSSLNTDPFQIKTPEGDDARVVIASQVGQQIRQRLIRRDLSILPKNDRNTSHPNDDGKYSGTVGSDVASPSAQVAPAAVPRTEVNTAINCVSNESKLVMSQTGLEAPNTRVTEKQEAAAQEPSEPTLVIGSSVEEGGLETARTVKPSDDNAASVSSRPKSVKLRLRQESPNTSQKQESTALESYQAKLVNEGSLGTAQTVKPHESGNNAGNVNDTRDSTCNKPSSSSISTSGDISSDKPEDETKDGSQFQQKTMSVMRGGEMVQVSYQVYIPKRAPALARRQLKR